MPKPEASSSEILKEYDASLASTKGFCEAVLALVKNILAAHNLNPHSIDARVKSRTSLSEKLSTKSKHYNRLSDITDIVGIRIITYLPEDVDTISGVIKGEFAIDEENSIDKRQILAPDRFGYLSFHHIVELSPSRRKLIEYKQYEGLKCEIQVRSILQHAWAEIQHDLGYKTKGEIPSQIKRRFFRLAGLLEIADDEFSRLKLELNTYQTEVSKEISEQNLEIEINRDSLIAFIESSEIINELDQEISQITKIKLAPQVELNYIKDLAFLNITTIQTLSQKLFHYRKIIPLLAFEICGEAAEENSGKFSRGISIFYLCYTIASDPSNKDKIGKYMEEIRGNANFKKTLQQARNRLAS